MKRTLLAAALLALAGVGAAHAAPAFTSTFTPAQLENRSVERRAVEAAIWGMPLVNFDAMRTAYFRDAGAKYNDFIYWSKPSTWQNQTTTPNHSTNYAMVFVNLKDGPVVVEIPAAQDDALYGAFVDARTVPLVNVGNTGADKGHGAKYLLLPPGYTAPVPQGYVAVQSSTFNAYLLLRVITDSHGEADIARGLDTLRQMKAYPLSQADAPPANRYVDMAGRPFDAVPAFDETYYAALARMVGEEPVDDRDLAIMGQLKTLGIGKDMTFAPDAKRNAQLKAAAAEARAYMMEGYATSGDVFWPAHHWRTLAPMDLAVRSKVSFVVPDQYVDLDQRAYAWFAMYGPVVPPAPQFYVKSYETGGGERLDGAHTYRLRVPANPPASQFWAVDVYDATTGAFIREAPVVGLDSYAPSLRKNDDGSVDVYLGPKAPPGQASNWVATRAGQPFFVMFRIYGPQAPLIKRTWALDDIVRVH